MMRPSGKLLSGLLAVGLLLVVFLAARRAPDADAGLEREQPAAEATRPLTVEPGGWTRDRHGLLFVTGVIANTTGRRLRYLEVTFPLFDAAGKQVGTAIANENNVAPGARWQFRALVSKNGVTEMGAPEIRSY